MCVCFEQDRGIHGIRIRNSGIHGTRIRDLRIRVQKSLSWVTRFGRPIRELLLKRVTTVSSMGIRKYLRAGGLPEKLTGSLFDSGDDLASPKTQERPARLPQICEIVERPSGAAHEGYGGRNEDECGVPSSGLHRARTRTAAAQGCPPKEEGEAA